MEIPQTYLLKLLVKPVSPAVSDHIYVLEFLGLWKMQNLLIWH